MYTNGRWKFLSQNNPVLIRSMRRCNIWVKKGFFNHFPNSIVASREEIAFPLLSWVHVVCSDMFHHIIERTCDIMHPTPSWWWHFAVTFPKLSMCFFFPSDRQFPQFLSSKTFTQECWPANEIGGKSNVSVFGHQEFWLTRKYFEQTHRSAIIVFRFPSDHVSIIF